MGGGIIEPPFALFGRDVVFFKYLFDACGNHTVNVIFDSEASIVVVEPTCEGANVFEATHHVRYSVFIVFVVHFICVLG
jgi:hypothetical protein